MKLQKFENVDVIASLEAIMKQNTAFYQSDFDCYPAFYLAPNHATLHQIKKRHSINYSDGFFIRLLYAVPFVLS
jgi:hypothetical protein